jgi:hypothetical protein
MLFVIFFEIVDCGFICECMLNVIISFVFE